MLSLQILVVFIIAQCCGHHHVHILKAFSKEHKRMPFKFTSFIQHKWIPFAEIKTKSAIQKRELKSGDTIPITEEKPPAPVIEHIEETENLEASSTFFGVQPPVVGMNRVPLTRSIAPGLNTNIQESLPPVDIFNPAQIPPKEPQGIGEIFEGLPPRPAGPIPAEPIPETMVVRPPTNPVIPPPPVQNPVPEEAPTLFNRTRVRQYAVYAGDVILKYLSQFFNRARLNFNRFTSPPPPTPVFEN